MKLSEATKIKELLHGKEHCQADIAALVGVSQATVSNVKRGRVFPEAPWPDGTTGAMPDPILSPQTGAVEEEPEAALRFDGWPEPFRERMLLVVNERRDAAGEALIPEQSVDMVKYLTTPMLAPDEKADLEGRARIGEIRRKALIMREFEGIVEEGMAAKRAATYSAIASASHTLKPSEQVELEAINKRLAAMRAIPPTYKSIPWATILKRVPANQHVRSVLTSRDKVEKLAVCIVFAHVPDSMWSQNSLAAPISSVRETLLCHQEIVDSIPDLPAPATRATKPVPTSSVSHTK